MEEKKSSDCGLNALKILLATLTHRPVWYFLNNNENHLDWSMAQIQKTAALYNLQLDGYAINDLKLLKKIRPPYIVYVKLNNQTHYMVVRKRQGNYFYLDDENFSSLSLSIKEFRDIFLNKALIPKKKQKIVHPKDQIYYLPPATNFLILVCYILAFLFILGFLYFLDQDLPVYFPILFLSASFAFDLIQKQILSSRMCQYDVLNSENFALIHKEKDLKSWLEKKKYLFGHQIYFLSILLPILFLSLILVLNDWLYFPFLTVLYGYIYLSQRKMHKDKQRLLYLEKDFPLFDELGFKRDNFTYMNQKSYRLSRNYLLYHYGELLLLIGGSILIMFYRHTTILNYYLFHIMTLMYLTQQSSGLYTYLKNQKNQLLQVLK